MLHIISVDAGTTGLKAVLFNQDGAVVRSSYREYQTTFPEVGWAEQEPDRWWKALSEAVRELTVRFDTEDIVGLGVTNQRETIIPVDRSCVPLRNAILWYDRRAERECEYLKDSVSKDLLDRTGLPVDSYFSLPKMLWIKNHEPNVYERTFKFLLVSDLINWRLTGEIATDYSNAGRTMLFDVFELKWNREISDTVGLGLDLLPETFPPGHVLGTLTGCAARELGLSQKTEVVLCGGDQQCAALGLGVVSTGITKATMGTGTFVLTGIERPSVVEGLSLSPHVVPDMWVLEGSILASGSIYAWLKENFGLEFTEMDRMAETSEPGSRGIIFKPYFTGRGAPAWDPDSKGAVHGLTLSHNRGDLFRACLEGIAAEVKLNLDEMESAGIDISEVRVTGGGSRSKVMNQVLSSCIDRAVVSFEGGEATTVGAFILTAVACGMLRDCQRGAKAVSDTQAKTRYLPRDRDAYRRYFEKYGKI